MESLLFSHPAFVHRAQNQLNWIELKQATLIFKSFSVGRQKKRIRKNIISSPLFLYFTRQRNCGNKNSVCFIQEANNNTWMLGRKLNLKIILHVLRLESQAKQSRAKAKESKAKSARIKQHTRKQQQQRAQLEKLFLAFYSHRKEMIAPMSSVPRRNGERERKKRKID